MVVGDVGFVFEEELGGVDELELIAPEATDDRRIEAGVKDESAALVAAPFARAAVLCSSPG